MMIKRVLMGFNPRSQGSLGLRSFASYSSQIPESAHESFHPVPVKLASCRICIYLAHQLWNRTVYTLQTNCAYWLLAKFLKLFHQQWCSSDWDLKIAMRNEGVRISKDTVVYFKALSQHSPGDSEHKHRSLRLGNALLCQVSNWVLLLSSALFRYCSTKCTIS
jgi:hypothetical protein